MNQITLLAVLLASNAAAIEYKHETINCSTGATRIEKIIQYSHESQFCRGNPACYFSRSTLSSDGFSVSEDAVTQSRPRDVNLYLVSPHATLDITNKICNQNGTPPRLLKDFMTKLRVKFDDGTFMESDAICTCFREIQTGH